ncbi:MarR family transcriptional regulator, partial [bacterium]|nr:MarR family transcriptional regulator [bacterium]
MKPSATTRLVRKINQSAILDLVRTSGPISRTEIAHRLHTSLPTVMRIIDDLVAENLVVEDGTFEVNGGRPRALLAFNGQAHTVIGLDLGGTQ